jgi:serine/threonine kinase 16
LQPENVLLDDDNKPVLMDFGSVAPADVQITTRSKALLLQEDAAQHCSMAYRAPELFDVQSDAAMDARIDVWSLGCLLFAMAFGWSPFECSFTSQGLKYEDCSYLRVIGKVSFPDPCKYSQQFCDIIL